MLSALACALRLSARVRESCVPVRSTCGDSAHPDMLTILFHELRQPAYVHV